MSLTLYFHPLASYCWKVLLALYENDTAFSGEVIDLGNPEARAEFLKIAPLGKFPVLQDTERDLVISESSIIIEYLAEHYPGVVEFVPQDADAAREARAQDRFFDWHVHEHMQKIVGDRIRPAGKQDPFGVEQAQQALEVAYGVLDRRMATNTWATGVAFGLADCAAAPALFYADKVVAIGQRFPYTAAYLQRLLGRPSMQRVLSEAEPYMKFFPVG